jgi:hypothetical protein
MPNGKALAVGQRVVDNCSCCGDAPDTIAKGLSKPQRAMGFDGYAVSVGTGDIGYLFRENSAGKLGL